MKTTPQLETVVINPPTTPKACVIWLHGLGADGYDFSSIVPQLGLPAATAVRFIFPHAPLRPVTLNSGYTMRAWFDIYKLEENAPIDLVGIKTTAQAIHHLIQQEIAYGIPAKNIVLAGFSQGGAMALYVGLRYSQRLAGMIGLSTFLPLADELINESNPANLDTPILLAHGTHDNVVPFSWGQMTYQNLKKLNYQVSFHSYNMQHAVCPQEINDIGKFLKGCFADQTPQNRNAL